MCACLYVCVLCCFYANNWAKHPLKGSVCVWVCWVWELRCACASSGRDGLLGSESSTSCEMAGLLQDALSASASDAAGGDMFRRSQPPLPCSIAFSTSVVSRQSCVEGCAHHTQACFTPAVLSVPVMESHKTFFNEQTSRVC